MSPMSDHPRRHPLGLAQAGVTQAGVTQAGVTRSGVTRSGATRSGATRSGATRSSGLALAGLLAVACAGQPETVHGVAAADLPAPLHLEGTAFDTAARLTLPAIAPGEYPGLHHVFRLSETIVSGAEPEGEAAFEQLADWGVKTVLSVDGKVPEAELAAQHGLRYVHVPIQYKGITEDELLRITKTFRELEAPFYVHCFHGKHRGPAASAIGRVVLDGAPRDRAIAEMRQWCETSGKYEGLYSTVATVDLPTPGDSAAYAFDFEPAHQLDDLRVGMVKMTRHFDNLELFEAADWQPLADHPDLDLLQEAVQLHQLTSQVHDLGATADWEDDFRGWMDESTARTAELVRTFSECSKEQLAASAEGADDAESAWRSRARELFQALDQSCKACHTVYRN